MPAVSEKGKAACARLYKRKPDASLDEFIAVAQKADPSIKEPKDRRSFNAKYVLPLKRSAAAKRRPRREVAAKRTTKKRGPGRSPKKIRPGRPTKRSGITAAKFASIKKMIISREQELMAAAGDYTKSYQLATEIDNFIEKLVKKVKG
jgi:hypothetical protein